MEQHQQERKENPTAGIVLVRACEMFWRCSHRHQTEEGRRMLSVELPSRRPRRSRKTKETCCCCCCECEGEDEGSWCEEAVLAGHGLWRPLKISAREEDVWLLPTSRSTLHHSGPSIPEIISGCHRLFGDTNVLTMEVILWVAVRRTFVQVTLPLDQNANRATLENTTLGSDTAGLEGRRASQSNAHMKKDWTGCSQPQLPDNKLNICMFLLT